MLTLAPEKAFFMKKLLILFLLLQSSLFAQNKTITIDEIWNGTFRPDYLYGLKAMPQSDKYSKIDINRQNKAYEIGIYNYATLTKETTAFSTIEFPSIGYFEYEFSPDEQKIIIGSQIESIYRHSRKGVYYVYNRQTKKLNKIADGKIQEPHFSPKGDKVAYIKDNNLFIKDLKTNQTVQITTDGLKNHIINGIPDWVYEEEFGYSQAYEWSPDGQNLAYVKFDETQVPEFSMIRYGEDLYPKVETFKYPKAGEKNSIVSLHYYNINSGKTYQVNLGKYEYIPRIKWADDNNLTTITLNRLQNHIRLYKYNIRKKKTSMLIDRTDEKYIDLEATDNLTFLPGGQFIWSNETSGFNHFYLYDKNGRQIRQITKGNWEITDFYGYDPLLNRIFYQSTETGSKNRAVYSIDLNGKHKKLLSPSNGTSGAEFSANHKYFINTFSNTTTPYTFTVNLGENGKVIKTIIDNNALLEKLKDYNLPHKEFTTFKSVNGLDLNAYIIKPVDFNPHKKYPVLLYVYGGPNIQTVRNSWNSSIDYYHYLLAQQGYIVVSVDPRGTGGRGAKFKKTTYKQLGKLELDDITAVAKQLGDLSYIDKTRIGIWGWSYGGFMSSNAVLKKDIFSMAIAVAPVTNWRFYDTVYTERYNGLPDDNPGGYDDNSPLFFTGGLKGKFLLIHGSTDDNVHVQNSMRLAKKLQENDQSFDEMIYTDKNHSIYGKKTRHHLFKKMLRYVKNNL